MSRFELGGFGLPIPLPEDGLELTEDSSHLQPLVYNLPDGTIFKPADYLAFGYTHYEVVCIGACGGRGARAGDIGGFPYSTEPDPIRGGGWIRAVWHDPYIGPTWQYGGAGGGGGLHVVKGRLDELPEEVPIVVGVKGADAPLGYIGPKPTPYTPVRADTPANGNDRYDGDITFYPPTAGEDGGHSAFGDVGQASGGKGGGPVKTVVATLPRNPDLIEAGTTAYDDPGVPPGGDGGDGGVGGTIVAGGGGSGGKTILHDPPPGRTNQYYTFDGVGDDGKAYGEWNAETGIGKGGGGGRGGAAVPGTGYYRLDSV